MIKLINLKEGVYPDVAVYMLNYEINMAKLSDINVIIAIHGYGSHGCGGLIKQEIHNNLRLLKSGHQIVDYVKGEQWSENNPIYDSLTDLEPELILNSQISNLNSGVTIVWVKK
ncbi:MAG TPA: hypothetical protein DD621_05030 [Clostridiales bacterium]|nr:hypothetical protein [Clostridiales bacterium]